MNDILFEDFEEDSNKEKQVINPKYVQPISSAVKATVFSSVEHQVHIHYHLHTQLMLLLLLFICLLNLL